MNSFPLNIMLSGLSGNNPRASANMETQVPTSLHMSPLALEEVVTQNVLECASPNEIKTRNVY